jgi:hypothetical protein
MMGPSLGPAGLIFLNVNNSNAAPGPGAASNVFYVVFMNYYIVILFWPTHLC